MTISTLCLTSVQVCRSSYLFTTSNVVITSHVSLEKPAACAINTSLSAPCFACRSSVTVTVIVFAAGAGWSTEESSLVCAPERRLATSKTPSAAVARTARTVFTADLPMLTRWHFDLSGCPKIGHRQPVELAGGQSGGSLRPRGNVRHSSRGPAPWNALA